MLLVAARDVLVGGEGCDLVEVLLCFVSVECFWGRTWYLL